MARPRKHTTPEQARAYHRAYMRRRRAMARTNPTMRERIQALVAARGPLTLKQLLACLGEGYERPAVYYHVRQLVQSGMLAVERDQGRTGDHSWFRYALSGASE